MEAFNPSDFESELHGIHASQGRLPEKGCILSLVAAYAQDIAYSYEYLQQYVDRMNNRGSGYVENYCVPIETPSRLEFLEALEFRESEITRSIDNNGYTSWIWPSQWEVGWGSGIESSLNSKNSKERLKVHLDQTKSAIAVQKALLGHHHTISLNCYIRVLLSRIINLFAKTDQFSGLPKMIQIVWSYDLDNSLRYPPQQDNRHKYRIDGVLGDYFQPGGGREPLIRVRRRAVDLCASELCLNTSHLENVIIVHELSHWLVHSWQHRSSNHNDEMTAWYEATGEDVHEAWAQLLTYLVCAGDEGITKTFEKLLPHQPPEYQLWEKVHAICGADITRLMKSLCDIRKGLRGIAFDDWLKMI